MVDLTGKTLGGRFELLTMIGEGGYGAVYMAQQLSMDRRIAVKVIHPKLANTKSMMERFIREAKIASQLKHPNTVVYYDFGCDEDLLYLAMEYVEGRTLSSVIATDGVVQVARVANMGRQICGALSEAHSHGMIHRDLKPGNILLTLRDKDPDFVKVIDFGLAKIVHGDQKGRDFQDVTESGQLLGTPAYMAPEQIRGETLDPRCDIYALGVILFAALSGKKPFAAATPLSTALMHLTEDVPSVSDLNPTVPNTLNLLVRACMAKDADERPQTVDIIAKHLNEFATVANRGVATPFLANPKAIEATATLDATPSSQRQAVLREVTGKRQIAQAKTLHSPTSQPPPSTSPRLSRALLGALTGILIVAAGLAIVLVNANDTGPSPRLEETTEMTELEHLSEVDNDVQMATPNDEEETIHISEAAQSAGDRVGHALGQAFSQSAELALPQTETESDVPSTEEAEDLFEGTGETVDRPGQEEDEMGDHENLPEVSDGVAAELPVPIDDEPERRGTGTLIVNAEPYGFVFCDGNSLGSTPVEEPLEVGVHNCRITSPDGREQSHEITIVRNETSSITVRFQQ